MRVQIFVAAALLGAAAAFVARAEGKKGEVVEYKDGDTVLEGYLAMPEGKPRGGVLVVHEWWGHDD